MISLRDSHYSQIPSPKTIRYLGSLCILLISIMSRNPVHCEIENLLPFQPSGTIQFQPIAAGDHFIADSQDTESDPYQIDYVDLLTLEVVRLNSSVPKFDKYKSFKGNRINQNNFLVLRNGHLSY